VGLDKFESLIHSVEKCRRCTRMIDIEGVLGAQCGSLDSKVLLIGEAPGRLGANISRIPFSGDQTGGNFEELIKSINWNRKMFFITNAVLCNPLDESGNNDKPKDSEIKNCSLYLEQIIDLINPKLIVTLGKNALKGLNYIEKHNIVLKNHVAQPYLWNTYTVFPLYHCSPRVFNIYRSKNLQLEDYRKLSIYVKENL
jgi:uracil-DNA glycosylase